MQRTRKLIIAIVFASVAALAVAAQAKNVTGNWKLTIETPNGPGTPSLVLKQEGEALSGTYKGRFGDSPLKGTVKGNEIKFNFTLDMQGNQVPVSVTGKIEGSAISGAFNAMGQAFDFSGTKKPN